MALGKAVVGTDIPGMREALGPGHEAFLAPPGEADRLAAATLSLLADPDERRRAGARNRRRIESRFSIDAMCEFLMSLPDHSLGGG